MPRAIALLLVALVLLPASAPAAGSDDPVPLPVAKSTILRAEGTVYLVEDEVTIPKGVEISVQKGIEIRGKGKDPILRLKGSLKIHGVGDKPVEMTGVHILLDEEFGTLHLDSVTLNGKGVGTVGGEAVSGMIVIENALFNQGATIDLKVASGSVDLFTVSAYEPTRVLVVPPKGSEASQVDVRVQGCVEGLSGDGGLVGGLTVDGAKELVLRRNALGGKECVFKNCADLMFDMNKVTCKTLVFEQENAKAFARLKIMKTDFHTKKVCFRAPRPEKGAVTVVANKCWWGGLATEKEVHAEIIEDGHDDEKVGVKLRLGKISPRRLGFAGK